MGESLISDAEWQVMLVVWERQPVDAQTVIDAVAQPNAWTVATVKTLLHRLVKKEVLDFTQEGKRYLYRARVRRSESMRQASRSFLERICGGHAAPALFHLVKEAKLTADEISELRRLLDNKDRSQ